MATKLSEVEGVEKDIFLSEVETARVRLKEVVSEIRTSLQQREEELCVELDRLEREHRDRVSEYRDKLTSLTAIQAGIEQQFKSEEFADLKKSILSDTNKKIEELERDYPPHRVEVVWEGGLVEKVKGMGKIVVSVGKSVKKCEMEEVLVENEIVIDADPKGRTKVLNVEAKRSGFVEKSVEKPLPIGVVNYRLRTKPVTTLGHPQLCCQYPQGIAYNNQDNAVYFVGIDSALYVIYLENTQVYSIKIPEPSLPINYRFTNSYFPYSIRAYGIAVLAPNIYISGTVRNYDRPDSLLVSYSSNIRGTSGIRSLYALSFGQNGSEEGELNSPTGITIDSDLIYVCDSKNNRVNVYTGKSFVRTITDPNLYLPLDVKVHEKRIFVLNSKPPYVLEFDHTGFYRDAFLTNSIVLDFVPSFFCVDRAGRFLISDKRQPYVYVLRRERSAAVEARLELEHGEDPLVEPRGVCLDGEGRVIVLCNYRQALLQIF